MDNKPLQISATKARAGVTSGHVRIILAVSMLFAILAMVVLYAATPTTAPAAPANVTTATPAAAENP